MNPDASIHGSPSKHLQPSLVGEANFNPHNQTLPRESFNHIENAKVSLSIGAVCGYQSLLASEDIDE